MIARLGRSALALVPLFFASRVSGQATNSANATPNTLGALESLESAFTQVAESVSGSVVTIRVESRRKRVTPPGGFPFGEWFGIPESREQYRTERGTGSGVVIRADGYVLTNKHVVENASYVEVVFRDGSHLQGKTVGIDDATDLAMVKVDAARLAAAKFADSNRAKPGQWVVAIGSPFGLDYTVTVGVVSAVGRGGMGANEIEDYLQTDASINPGNSGGPLVNLRGEVLGINTMIVGQGTGIGFAIPSNLARVVAEQLIDKGSVHRAYIGVGFQELTPDLAKHFGVLGKGGALVSSIVPQSPADKAGILAGDVVVSVDGQAVVESRDLLRALLQRPVGAKVNLGVVREKKERAITLVTVERPGTGGARANAVPDAKPARDAGRLGLHLEVLSKPLAARLGFSGAQGAVVSSVERGSRAERAGLMAGDLIVEADRTLVKVPADVEAALADGSALLHVRRGNSASYMVLSRN
jgi:Do/DeqQ family serine protease